MSSERRLRPRGVVCGHRRVLRAVPNVDIVIGRESRNDVRVLWLVTGFVDLTGVRDLLYNREFNLLFAGTVAAKLFGGWVVVREIGRGRLGEADVCDLKIVRLLARCMGSDDQAVGAEGRARNILHIWQPLGGQGRPFERTAVHDVVKEDTVLLPDLVLLIDELVLDNLLVFGSCNVGCE